MAHTGRSTSSQHLCLHRAYLEQDIEISWSPDTPP